MSAALAGVVLVNFFASLRAMQRIRLTNGSRVPARLATSARGSDQRNALAVPASSSGDLWHLAPSDQLTGRT